MSVKHTYRYIVADVSPDAQIVLCEADSHHLTRVVRRSVGDEIELIDADGRLWPATIVAIEPCVHVRTGSSSREAPPSPPIGLYVGLADFGRLDTLVEKATEIGVARITLMATGRVRRLPDDGAVAARTARMTRVAQAAAKQSGRAVIPEIRGLLRFEDVLAEVDPASTVVVDPRGTLAVADVLSGLRPPLALIVGSDAGFDPGEIERASAVGIAIARMGDAVLRTETAGIVALTLAAAAHGYLGA